jgi:hypothetical protein
MKKKSIFIGSISADPRISGAAHSNAGQLIQEEILGALSSQETITSAFLMPLVAYPNGNILYLNGKQNDSLNWLSYVNLPIVKHITFSINLIIFLIKNKPSNIFSYNSYFFQNIAIILYRSLFSKNTRWCTFVQDILPANSGLKSIQRYLDRKSISLLKYCDLIAPVTQKIIDDFNIKKTTIIIPGGITKAMLENVYNKSIFIENQKNTNETKYIFAGSLTSYNGIDKLVDSWIKQNITSTLHVYGNGPLRQYIDTASKRCSTIKYHGPASHETVTNAYLEAKGIIVLRYSDGIEAEYFFPSKFFEAIISPCAVITNRFPGLQDQLTIGCNIIDEDLKNLREIIDQINIRTSDDMIKKRREAAIINYSYSNQLLRLTKMLNES